MPSVAPLRHRPPSLELGGRYGRNTQSARPQRKGDLIPLAVTEERKYRGPHPSRSNGKGQGEDNRFSFVKSQRVHGQGAYVLNATPKARNEDGLWLPKSGLTKRTMVF